jgi:hypothetical protein
MAFGVYGIFMPENYVYIGSTIADFNTRHRVHMKALRDNKHDNDKLQELWNKYQKADFVTLEECTEREKVRETEQYFMEKLPSEGYILCNETPALVEGNPLGDIVKAKISAARRGGRKRISSHAPKQEEVPQKGLDDFHKRMYQMRKEQGW